MERVRLENEAERRFRSSLNKSGGSDIKDIKEDEDEYDEEV